jgi:hypothetical protein
MSMVRCDECEHLIDSDEDCDCFGGIPEGILCQWCREANEIDDDPDSAEVQIERRADFILRELDEFCALATHHETIDLIEGQRIAIGQIMTRTQLILSFLQQRNLGRLRIISNG